MLKLNFLAHTQNKTKFDRRYSMSHFQLKNKKFQYVSIDFNMIAISPFLHTKFIGLKIYGSGTNIWKIEKLELKR